MIFVQEVTNSWKINNFNYHSIRIYNYLAISAGETAEFYKYKLNLTLMGEKSIFCLWPD